MTLNSLTNGFRTKPFASKQETRYVVQKFGGTSVGKFAHEIVANVIKPSLVHDSVAVVCSAISSTVKAEGTTNRYVPHNFETTPPVSKQIRLQNLTLRFQVAPSLEESLSPRIPELPNPR